MNIHIGTLWQKRGPTKEAADRCPPSILKIGQVTAVGSANELSISSKLAVMNPASSLAVHEPQQQPNLVIHAISFGKDMVDNLPGEIAS